MVCQRVVLAIGLPPGMFALLSHFGARPVPFIWSSLGGLDGCTSCQISIKHGLVPKVQTTGMRTPFMKLLKFQNYVGSKHCKL